jgi:hypothetical protein
MRVRRRGESRKEFNCEVGDKLADWDYLEYRMLDGYRRPRSTEICVNVVMFIYQRNYIGQCKFLSSIAQVFSINKLDCLI